MTLLLLRWANRRACARRRPHPAQDAVGLLRWLPPHPCGFAQPCSAGAGRRSGACRGPATSFRAARHRPQARCSRLGKDRDMFLGLLGLFIEDNAGVVAGDPMPIWRACGERASAAAACTRCAATPAHLRARHHGGGRSAGERSHRTGPAWRRAWTLEADIAGLVAAAVRCCERRPRSAPDERLHAARRTACRPATVSRAPRCRAAPCRPACRPRRPRPSARSPSARPRRRSHLRITGQAERGGVGQDQPIAAGDAHIGNITAGVLQASNGDAASNTPEPRRSTPWRISQARPGPAAQSAAPTAWCRS